MLLFKGKESCFVAHQAGQPALANKHLVFFHHVAQAVTQTARGFWGTCVMNVHAAICNVWTHTGWRSFRWQWLLTWGLSVRQLARVLRCSSAVLGARPLQRCLLLGVELQVMRGNVIILTSIARVCLVWCMRACFRGLSHSDLGRVVPCSKCGDNRCGVCGEACHTVTAFPGVKDGGLWMQWTLEWVGIGRFRCWMRVWL